MVIVGKWGIQEIHQDSFVRFGAENPFEAEVGKENDVLILEIVSHGWVGCRGTYFYCKGNS